MKQDDYVKSRLVEMGWRFGQSYVGAAGGHLAGQMIMQTIANRVRQGWASWLQTLDRVPQYMAENEMPPLVHPPIWEPSFIKLLQSVEGVFDNSIADLSKGALYWGDLAKLERAWFVEKIAQGKKTINISDGGVELVEVPAHMRVACMNGLSFWS